VIVSVGSESAKGSGVLMDSVIMTGNLATIHDSEIDRVIGIFTGLKGSTPHCEPRWHYSWEDLCPTLTRPAERVQIFGMPTYPAK
jgi:hypothetical protein